MNKMRKTIKVIIGLIIAISAVCFLLLSSFRYIFSTKKTAESDYRQGAILVSEAEKYKEMRQWERAVEKYKLALKEFEAIKQKFPDWETSIVSEEYAAAQKKIDLLEAVILSDLGLEYFEKREYDDALKTYNKLLEKYGEKYKEYPFVLTAWSHLGHIYRIKGKYEKALEFFNIANQYRGQKYLHFLSCNQMGMLATYQAMGRYDEAEKLLQKVMAEDPSFLATFQSFFEILPVKSWGELGKAINIILEFIGTRMSEEEFRRSIIQVNSSLENDTFAFIGLKLQYQGKIDEAKKYYQKCIDNSLNKESIGYKAATAALQRLREKTK